MRKRFDKRAWQLCIPAMFALIIQIVGPLPAAQEDDIRYEGRVLSRRLARFALPGTQDLQLIIQLNSPSAVEWALSQAGGSRAMQTAGTGGEGVRMNLQSAQLSAYRVQAARERQALADQVAALPGVEIQDSTDTVLNSVIARVPLSKYDEVRRMPGVRQIYISRQRRKLLDAAATVVNAEPLWNISGGRAQAGKGIKIGIIDSGIDITHPMFIDSSLVAPAGFPKGETRFVNSKVIVARNYINLLANRQSVQTAIDEQGHGTFVAGVAAGKQVDAPYGSISGMAPAAFLGSYKVFGTPGINDSTTDAAVIAAVNAAVADGMDVINLSLGFLDYLPPSEDPEVAALTNAIAAGVIVTLSAGNDGPEPHTISSPGTTPDAITVGAVSNARMLANWLHLTDPAPVPASLTNIPYVNGDGPQFSSQIPSTGIVDVASLDGNGYACSAFPANSLKGKIALAQRGGVGSSCTFLSKVNNCTAAGAIAVVVYNNIPNENPFTMGNLGTSSIPAVMISNANGLALKEIVASSAGAAQVSIDPSSTIAPAATTAGILTSFSSVGPGMDFSIKPDLVAVGENVYSAAESVSPGGDLYSASKYTWANGTSFSAPMVAGAAAAIKQLYPALSPWAIKSILTSTASPTTTVDGTNPADLLQMGAGLLNMGAAASAGAAFAPVSLNFGVQAYSGTLFLTRSLVITNTSSKTDQFSISINEALPGPVFSLSQTTTGPIPPGSTSRIDVTLQVAAPLSGGFQGNIAVRSANTFASYRIPYWAGLYLPDSSRILTVRRDQSGNGSYSSLAAAVRAARPGNIIEIADSGTYAAGLIISTNDEGLPLHGLTIRARPDRTPLIAGTTSTEIADIRIIGVRNVSLQGLTINGGPVGILLEQPSTAFPVSATIDHCTVTGATDSNSGAVMIDGGGTLNVTKSTISNSAGSGIIAYDGAYLTVLGSTIQGNDDGIEGLNANVDILNSTITGNRGPGLLTEYCSGTLDGSTFSLNRGTYGDGADIAAGTFTISNNIFESNDQIGLLLTNATSTGSGATVTLARNKFLANATGVYANPARNLLMDSNLIKDNGRGIRLTGSTSALLVNNIVVRSTSASQGNGIELASTAGARIVNNTIYKNTLRGIANTSTGTIAVANTIVSGNGGGDLLSLPSGSVQFSLIGDGTAAASGNVTGDPKFSSADADDFSLLPGSPALDAGSNTVVGLPFLDFNQQIRVAPGSSAGALPGDGRVDIGATEAYSAFPLLFPLLANGAQPALGDSYVTGYAVLNNGSAKATTAFSAYDAAGGRLPGISNPAALSIGVGAQIPRLAYDLFGQDPAAAALGSVLASAQQPISGFFLLFDPAFSRFSSGINASDQTGTDLIFMSHQSDSSGKARYFIFNPGPAAANISATPTSARGAPLEPARNAIIAPKGQLLLTFDNITTSSGLVRLQSDQPVSGLEVLANSQGFSVLGAVSPGSESRLYFPHIAVNQDFTTVIGIVNASGSQAGLLLTAYSNNGQVLGTPIRVTLPANGQLLQSVDSLFGIPGGPLTTGYIIAESGQPGVQGFTQFSYASGANRSAAAVPADSVPRQRLIFSHVAHQVPAGPGVTYQTGIALLNPFSTTVNYTLSVFDGSGAKLKELSDTLGPGEKVAKILSHVVPGAGFFTDPMPLNGGHVEVQTDYGLLGFELFFTETYSQLASVPAQTMK